MNLSRCVTKDHRFRATTNDVATFGHLLSGTAQNRTVYTRLYRSSVAHARQAELSITPAMRAIVLKASEKETAGGVAMR